MKEFTNYNQALALKEYVVKTECTAEEEEQGLLQVIYENGKFYNQITLDEIRAKINEL